MVQSSKILKMLSKGLVDDHHLENAQMEHDGNAWKILMGDVDWQMDLILYSLV